jgi:hypothetical protein
MRNTHELEEGGHKTTAAKKYFSKRETQNKQVVMHRDSRLSSWRVPFSNLFMNVIQQKSSHLEKKEERNNIS